MRITMQSIHYNILTNLNKITTDMNRINNQISSGKQMSTISDNPVNLVTALGLRSNLTQITSYQSNLLFGDKSITAAENALTQMKELAARAKVLSIQAANGSMTAENRGSMAEEVQHLFESAITLGNTSVNGKYIFGGFRTTGYTAAEPVPFIQDARDGYFVNGGRMADSSSTQLTGTVADGATADITTGDLLINGLDVVDVLGVDIDLTNAGVNGLNMDGAVNLANAINDQTIISQTGASDTLASPHAGAAATGTANATRVAFYLNGDLIDVTTGAGDTASDVADTLVAAINGTSSTVTATKGTGGNGGAANSIILRSNDGSPMTITGLNPTEKTISGLSDNTATEGVSAKLTTLYSSGTAAAGANSAFFYLNGVPVSYSTSGATPADDAVAAINAVANQTGVSARVGDGSNGGGPDEVVLYNTLAGDESNITITGFAESGPGTTGLADIDQAVDNTHNTGTISLSSSSAFTITSDNYSDDTILDLLGLGTGPRGFADNPGDGVLRYGSSLASGDLSVNGVAITTSVDGISDVYQNISAAAKADAINNATSQTGVSAKIIPAILTAAQSVQAGTEAEKLTWMMSNTVIPAGSLSVNGVLTTVAIPPAAVTNGLNTGKAFNYKAVINSMSNATGVTASLTTMMPNNTAANPLAGTNSVSFDLNGVTIALNTTGTTPNALAQEVVDAINTLSGETNVRAVVGDGTNGGVTDSIVLYNTMPGDESDIVLANLDVNEATRLGLATGTISVDDVNNTGGVTFSSDAPFTLMNPSNPASRTDYGSTPVYLKSGDLVINGIDIFSHATAISSGDSGNALINAINAKTDETGVKAGRNASGQLILSAVDGRNLHLQTSALGEKVTQLTGNSGPQDQVYQGQVRLWAGDEFFLESTTAPVGAITNYETGLAALGLTGGETFTGQSGDVANDGKIFVNKINADTGYVRYAGDRKNDFSVNVGQRSTLEIAKNGEAGIMATGLFSVLKNLVNYLRGDNYTTLDGAAKATNTNALLNSGETGLALEDELQNGSFTITVTSHDTSPATTLSTVPINIDITKDSLTDIASRINGVPGISASWSADGHLQINSTDPDRYTFSLSDDTSNFLRVTGSAADNLQVSNLSKSISDLDDLMQNLTTQVSDFGARANRIIVQQQIYTNLELSTKENLSEKEDTDITKALLEIKSKETAYEAALAAAAKTMQLSLVDFLK